MPSGDYSGKERQSVYEKALVICHEGEKELSLLQKDLDRSKLQTYISYKLEERQLRNELFRIKREQINLAKEAKQRERDNKSIDDIAKEMKVTNPGNRGAMTIKLEKKFALPEVNCTQKNVPKILRRTLSHESEYFTWTFGLPKIENAVKALNPADNDQKKKGKVDSKGTNESEGVQESDEVGRARANTIHNIVYNVPVTEPKRGNSITQGLPPINTKLPKINVTVTPDTGVISSSKSNHVKLPKI
ncbi:uncharacterized protein LOC144636647 [Oculina patagonica]